jgi:hypothetical protein
MESGKRAGFKNLIRLQEGKNRTCAKKAHTFFKTYLKWLRVEFSGCILYTQPTDNRRLRAYRRYLSKQNIRHCTDDGYLLILL